MPIQILNSGVNLTPRPNTSSVVVCRNEAGIVCRTYHASSSSSSSSRHGRKRCSSQQLSRGGSVDAGDGSSSAGCSSGHGHHHHQRTSLFLGFPCHRVGGGGDDDNGCCMGDGGTGFSSHDMTSVLGLEVHRLKGNQLSAEKQSRRANRASAAQALATPETEGGGSSAGGGGADAAESDKSQVWLRRAGGGRHDSLPAHATLTERVRQGNNLVKSVKAGRSLRLATQRPMKGALEIGLWAASRPEHFARTNAEFATKIDEKDKPSTVKGANPPGWATGPRKSRLFGEGSGYSDGSEGGGGCGGGGGGGDRRESIARGVDRVKVLESKLRAIEHHSRRTRRLDSSSCGDGDSGEGGGGGGPPPPSGPHHRDRNASHSSRSGAAATTTNPTTTTTTTIATTTTTPTATAAAAAAAAATAASVIGGTKAGGSTQRSTRGSRLVRPGRVSEDRGRTSRPLNLAGAGLSGAGVGVAGVGGGAEHGGVGVSAVVPVKAAGDAARLNEKRVSGSSKSASHRASKVALNLDDAGARTSAEEARADSFSHSPPGGSLTSRSLPTATRQGLVPSRPHGPGPGPVSARVVVLGPRSARRAPPGTPVVISAAVKKELKAAVKAYVLRQTALDDVLAETMQRREFDWDTDMRTMMDAVKIASAGTGKRFFESVPKVMRRQVQSKRRVDEARSLQGTWFPSMTKRILLAVRHKERGGMPACVTKLAAALYKVLVSGYTVTPNLFWSLVSASFRKEDHRSKAAQKMVLACLSFVRQTPEDYNAFLAENSIKVPASLRQGFHKASLKRTNKKGVGAKRNGGNSSSSGRISSRPRTTASEGDRGGGGGGGGGASEGGVGSLALADTTNTREGRPGGGGGDGVGVGIGVGVGDGSRGGDGSRQGSLTAGNAIGDDSDDGSETWSGLSLLSRETTATGSFLKGEPAVDAGQQQQ